MPIISAIELGLLRLAEVSVKPNPDGLPGLPTAEKAVNGLAAFLLVGAAGAIIIGAAEWALGNRSNNVGYSDRGKGRVLAGIGVAFLVGAISAIVNFFFDLGTTVR